MTRVKKEAFWNMKALIDKLQDILGPPLDPADTNAQMLAGVSVALRERERDADFEALFIRRSVREDDPWSGHMAFPGGRFDDGDGSLKHTAIRETQEEIGLDLVTFGEYLGALKPLEPMRSTPPRNIIIEPHFFLVRETPTLTLDHKEVADAMWLPLTPMINGETHSATEYFFDGRTHQFPSFETPGDQPIWGLTYRILENLFGLIDPEFKPLDLSQADLVTEKPAASDS